MRSYLIGRLVVLLLPGVLLGVPSLAQGTLTYTFGPLSYTFTTFEGFIPIDINNRGDILGGGGVQNGDTFTTIDVPGFSAVDFNDHGDLLGYYVDATGTRHASVLGGDTFTTIDVPGGTSIEVSGINNRGDIVGSADFGKRGLDGMPIHDEGILLSGGTLFRIDASELFHYGGSVNTRAMAINDRGQIVGQVSHFGGWTDGFLLSEGTYTSIPMPCGPRYDYIFDCGDPDYAILPRDINNRGQIVGSIFDSHFLDYTAFVLRGDTLSLLHVPGAIDTHASGINDRGQIVGSYRSSHSGPFYGFLGTPVPEPSTLALLGLALVGLSFARRRNNSL